jgi:membrane-associated phospholipid phosphatase
LDGNNLGRKTINDLKQLWFDFRWVYPNAFNRIFANWQLSLLSVFIVISAFYLDGAVTNLITGLKSGLADRIFEFGRWYGHGTATLYLFIGFYVIGLFFNKDKLRDTGLLIGETFVFAGFVSLLFKSFFGRWRPFTNHGDFAFYGFTWSDNDHLSFTSGHANVAFCLSTVLASTTDNIYLKILYYVPAVITGLSRIYHDQHWLSDVIVGAMIAVLVSRVLIRFHDEAKQKV